MRHCCCHDVGKFAPRGKKTRATRAKVPSDAKLPRSSQDECGQSAPSRHLAPWNPWCSGSGPPSDGGQAMKQVLLYLPVVHAGHEGFFARHADAAEVLILGTGFRATFKSLAKDIRALP